MSLPDTVAFITSEATEEDLGRVIDAVKMRRQTLRAIAAAAVTVGATVKLDGLSPKYLNGLAGTVEAINGQRAEVLLDEESTQLLRLSGSRRYYIPLETKRFLLHGVPLSCCR